MWVDGTHLGYNEWSAGGDYVLAPDRHSQILHPPYPPPQAQPAQSTGCVLASNLLPESISAWVVVPCDEPCDMGVLCQKPGSDTQHPPDVELQQLNDTFMRTHHVQTLQNITCAARESMFIKGKCIRLVKKKDIDPGFPSSWHNHFVENYIRDYYSWHVLRESLSDVPEALISPYIYTKDGSFPFSVMSEDPIILSDLSHDTKLFACGDRTLIYNEFVCDGQVDCADGTDENDCEEPCYRSETWVVESSSNSSNILLDCSTCTRVECTCSAFYYHCESGGCVPQIALCDTHFDCEDGSDERYCSISADETAPNRTGSLGDCHRALCGPNPGCFYPSLVQNNLHFECSDGVDEPILLSWWKENSASILTYPPGVYYPCLPDTLPCLVGFDEPCFTLDKLCKMDIEISGLLSHCGNGGHLMECRYIECPDMFKCPGSYCVPYTSVCDGIRHCPGGEDEAPSCSTTSSCPGFLKCKDSAICVPPNSTLYDQPQCPVWWEDVSYFRSTCPKGCVCRGNALECTGLGWYGIPVEVFYAVSLNLSGNSIVLSQRIFDTMPVAMLDLSRNGIKDIGFYLAYHVELIVLDLSHNDLTFLPTGCFSHLSHIRAILIHSNHIAEMAASLLQINNSLHVFDLSENPLRRAGVHMDALKELRMISHLLVDDHTICCGRPAVTHCQSAMATNCAVDVLNNTHSKVLVWVSSVLCLVLNVAMLFLVLTSTARFYRISQALCGVAYSIYLAILGCADVYHQTQESDLLGGEWVSGSLCISLAVISTLAILWCWCVQATALVFTYALLSLSLPNAKTVSRVGVYTCVAFCMAVVIAACFFLYVHSTPGLSSIQSTLCHLFSPPAYYTPWAVCVIVFLWFLTLLTTVAAFSTLSILARSKLKAKRSRLTTAERRMASGLWMSLGVMWFTGGYLTLVMARSVLYEKVDDVWMDMLIMVAIPLQFSLPPLLTVGWAIHTKHTKQ